MKMSCAGHARMEYKFSSWIRGGKAGNIKINHRNRLWGYGVDLIGLG